MREGDKRECMLVDTPRDWRFLFLSLCPLICFAFAVEEVI
jgi:hypothetical protein